MKELLLGCGFTREKLIGSPGDDLTFKHLTTLDINLSCSPDIVCDLDRPEWRVSVQTERGRECVDSYARIKADYFDEVHACEALEHLGQQGDAPSFFATFRHCWSVLRPGGFLFGSTPSRYSGWVWGDPSHRRAIFQESLAFLSQDIIRRNRKAGTPMSDFSLLWKHDFKIVASTDNTERHLFCLQKML